MAALSGPMVKPDGCPAYTNISGAIGPALEPKATSLRRQAQSVEKNEPPQVGGKMPGTQEIRTPRLLLRRHVAAERSSSAQSPGSSRMTCPAQNRVRMISLLVSVRTGAFQGVDDAC